MSDDNIVDFKVNRLSEKEGRRWMEEFYQRNKQAKADILASLERLDSGDVLYSVWMEINFRLIEKHGASPDSLAQEILIYCGDDDEESEG